MLGRFLIIQGSRPSLVPKLEETIGEYEMSVVPCSLCAVDGTLYIPTDKVSLMLAVEDAKAEPLEVVPQPDLMQEDLPGIPQLVKVLIVDAMAVLQSMKKTPAMLKLAELQDAFNKCIKTMMAGCDERHIVLSDRYESVIKE